MIALSTPFARERVEFTVDEGATLQSVIDEATRRIRPSAGEPAVAPPSAWRVIRNGDPVDDALLASATVQHGDVLVLVPAPGATLLLIGKIIFYIALVASAALSILSAFGVFAPKVDKADGQEQAIAPTVEGTRNEARFNDVVPRVFGRHRIYPDLAAQPYVKSVGDTQYLNMLFCCGYGPLAISDMRIGETPLASFDDVQFEVRESFNPNSTSMSVYPDDVAPLSVGVDMKADAISTVQEATRTTALDTDFAVVELIFPQGLLRVSDSGKNRSFTVGIDVEFRLFGSTGAWTTVFSKDVADAQMRTKMIGVRLDFPARGQYDVRVRRREREGANNFPPANGGSGDDVAALISDLSWSTLASHTARTPVTLAGTCLIAIRVKATDQLNGIIDRFNCIAESKFPVWDGAAWSAPQVTRNPAWAYADVLRGPANKRAVSDSRLDLPTLKAWADRCTAAGTTFDYYLTEQSTALDMLQMIARSADASFHQRDSLFSVIEDRVRTSPVQVFTPRNSWGFQGQRGFLARPPHALRVRFVDESSGFQEDVRIVYDDGYDASTATLYEGWEIPGVTDRDRVWQAGRREIARRRLRPELYQLNVDFEHLVAERGDLVLVAHDVPAWGDAWHRLRGVTPDASGVSIAAVRLDGPVTLDPALNYAVRIRTRDGAALLASLAHAQLPGPGAAEYETRDITFTVPLGASTGGYLAAVGDIAIVGLLGTETVPLLIEAVEPRDDLSARLTLVDYAPAIFDADTGPIPAFSANISSPLAPLHRKPPAPTIVSVRASVASRTDGGAPVFTILAAVKAGSGAVSTRAYLAQIRVPALSEAGSQSEWIGFGETPASQGYVEIGPITGLTEGVASYDFRVRAVSVSGEVSDWVTASSQSLFGAVPAPTHLRAAEAASVGPSGARLALRLSWDIAGGGTPPVGFVVRWRVSGGAWTMATVYGTRSYDVLDARRGVYEFEVRSVGTVGEGAEATLTYDYVPDVTGGLLPVTGLSLDGLGHGTSFTGREAKLIWRRTSSYAAPELGADPAGNPALDPFFGGFEVRIVDPATGEVVRSEVVQTETYTYTAEKNLEDSPLNAATGRRIPRRSFRVEVRVLDQIGHVSVPSSLVVSNAAPPAPSSVSVATGSGTVFVTATGSDDPDRSGFIVWASDASGFAVGDATEVARGAESTIVFAWPAGTTCYLRVAAFDAFGDTSLNVSAEYSVAVGSNRAGKTVFGTFTVFSSLPTEITVFPSPVWSDGAWNGYEVEIVSGAGMGQARRILATVSGDTVRVDPLLVTLPQTGDVVQIVRVDIEDGAVNELKILDGTITRAKIGLAAIGAAQIEDAVIHTAKIVDAAIKTAKIDDLQVGTSKIAYNAATVSASGSGTATYNGSRKNVCSAGYFREDASAPVIVIFQWFLSAAMNGLRMAIYVEDNFGERLVSLTPAGLTPDTQGTVMMAVSIPGAGNIVFRGAANSGGTGSTTVTGTILVLETKR